MASSRSPIEPRQLEKESLSFATCAKEYVTSANEMKCPMPYKKFWVLSSFLSLALLVSCDDSSKDASPDDGQNATYAAFLSDTRVSSFVSNLPQASRPSGSFFFLDPIQVNELEKASSTTTSADGRIMKTITSIREGNVRTITTTEYLDSSDLEDSSLQGGEADPKPEPKRLEVIQRTFDELGRLIETRDEDTYQGKTTAKVTTREYTNADNPKIWSSQSETETDADGSVTTAKVIMVVGTNGGYTIDRFENDQITSRNQRSCENLTCTDTAFDVNEAGELIEDRRTVTTYFGGIGGLIEREERKTDTQTNILEATFASDGSFNGYSITGTQSGPFWGRQGKVDFTVNGTCVISENIKITCTTTKTTDVDLTVVDVGQALYAVLTNDDGVSLVPQPTLFETTITDKGVTNEYRILKSEYDENYRLIKNTFSLLGNPEPNYDTYEYNGPSGALSKKTRYNANDEVLDTTVYTYN